MQRRGLVLAMVVGILLLCLDACSQVKVTPLAPTPTPATASPTLSSADRIAIYSTVAHYHFDPGNRILGDQHWPVIFVSPKLASSLEPTSERWNGDPTPPELLPQLQDLAPRIEFATLDAVVQRDKMNAVREGGIWLGFGSIQMNGSEVQVQAESFQNGVNAAVYVYRVARQGNGWIILEARLQWIA